jgi:hypothetical protein
MHNDKNKMDMSTDSSVNDLREDQYIGVMSEMIRHLQRIGHLPMGIDNQPLTHEWADLLVRTIVGLGQVYNKN